MASRQVFISHSSKDKDHADTICRSLESGGVTCWIAPRDIRPGSEYAEGIIDAIENSSYMVLVLSAASNDSPQVLREVERAVNKSVPIIPFRIQDVPLSKSLEYFISSHHWLDASSGSMDGHVASLTQTIKQYMEQPMDNPKPQPAPEPAGSAFSWRILIWATLAAFVILGLVALLYFANPLSPSRPMDDQSARLWHSLATLGDNAQGEVAVAANQDRFQVGETMELSVTAPSAGFINVLHMHELEDQVTVLFPNRFQPDNWVEAGQELHIPGPEADYTLTASLPPGLSQIVVLLTEHPLNAYDLPNESQVSPSVFASLSRNATRSFVVQASSQDSPYALGRIQVMVIE